MTEIKLENIDGHPVALAVEDGQIICRRLDEFAAPREKSGFFGFSDLEDFMMFVGEQGALGTSLWILPEPTDGIVLTAIIDGHTHYHPGRLAFRANYFAKTFSTIDERLIEEFCQDHQFPLYRGVPADPVAAPVVNEGSTIAAGCEDDEDEFDAETAFTHHVPHEELLSVFSTLSTCRDYINGQPMGMDPEVAKLNVEHDLTMTMKLLGRRIRDAYKMSAQPAADEEAEDDQSSKPLFTLRPDGKEIIHHINDADLAALRISLELTRLYITNATDDDPLKAKILPFLQKSIAFLHELHTSVDSSTDEDEDPDDED